MKRYVASALAAAVTLVVACVGTALAGPGESAGWLPPHDTIVKVTGTAEDGFGIFHFDGTAIYPPTFSEARAECQEYARRLDRVRCRVELRTWYADLADLKVALRWANR